MNASAIVSGGASGLGLATTHVLAARGYQVIAADLPDACAALTDLPDLVSVVPTDVTDPAQVRAAVAAAVEHAPLQVAVACAGIGDNRRVIGSRGPMDISGFERVIGVNLTGSASLLIEAAAAMQHNEPDESEQRGVIVLTASIAAYDGGSLAYSASKAGVVGMTLPAAQNLAPFGIRVMSIAPGFFETPMLRGMPAVLQEQPGRGHFPRRAGRPDEFGELVGDIVDNRMLNGECIRLDAAYRMPAP